jgi:hypothetical protein
MNVFQDDAAAASIGDLSVENGTDSVRIFGELVVRKDKASLQNIEALERHVQAIKAYLVAQPDLPEECSEEAPAAVEIVTNPFG